MESKADVENKVLAALNAAFGPPHEINKNTWSGELDHCWGAWVEPSMGPFTHPTWVGASCTVTARWFLPRMRDDILAGSWVTKKTASEFPNDTIPCVFVTVTMRRAWQFFDTENPLSKEEDEKYSTSSYIYLAVAADASVGFIFRNCKVLAFDKVLEGVRESITEAYTRFEHGRRHRFKLSCCRSVEGRCDDTMPVVRCVNVNPLEYAIETNLCSKVST